MKLSGEHRLRRIIFMNYLISKRTNQEYVMMIAKKIIQMMATVLFVIGINLSIMNIIAIVAEEVQNTMIMRSVEYGNQNEAVK